jgi:hypothetical protein
MCLHFGSTDILQRSNAARIPTEQLDARKRSENDEDNDENMLSELSIKSPCQHLTLT